MSKTKISKAQMQRFIGWRAQYRTVTGWHSMTELDGSLILFPTERKARRAAATERRSCTHERTPSTAVVTYRAFR